MNHYVKEAIHVASHHIKHQFLHSASNHPLGTGIGCVAGIGLAAVATPVVTAAGVAAGAATAVAVVGCGILGGKVEKAVKKH